VNVVVTVVAVVATLAVTRQTAGQAQSWQFPQTADGTPDLSGLWQAVGSTHWDIEPHAAYENRRTKDPEAKCYLPGVPRANYLPFPFQIVQGGNKIFIAYEFASANRVIHMDPVPESPVDTWMGHSMGRWDGDSLVVDVTAFNGQTWFDRAGNHHSSALHVVERYTPMTPNHLQYEATIEDPNTFTRPWKISLPLYRRMEKNMQLLNFRCVEFSEELLYGHLRKQP
jgi:hypothetical protein